jgi:L-alanine-DL-glutamate epimerase-like enolase superfamily enzyme
MQITRITGTPVFIPYASPVGPYQGRGGKPATKGASALIVKVETDAGLVGWGEGTGRFDADPGNILAGRNPLDIESAVSLMDRAGMGRGPMSGVEMALWDLAGKAAGQPLCRLMGGLVRSEVDFCGCMGLKEPSDSAATARAYIERWGFRFIKTKAGDNIERDLAIAKAVVKEIGDDAVLRPDANSGYAPSDTVDNMKQMADIGVGCFEDPCGSDHPETLAAVRQQTGVKVLVNMGVGLPDSIPPILNANAADMLMPDTPASGALLRIRRIAAIAEAWGVPCLMHCSHDLGLKTAAVLQIAACTPNWSGPNDTCYHGLTDDVLTEPFVFADGRLQVPLGQGLGVEVDERKLVKYLVA